MKRAKKPVLKPVEAESPEDKLLVSILSGYAKEYGSNELIELLVKSLHADKVENCEISDLTEVLFERENGRSWGDFKYLSKEDAEQVLENMEGEVEDKFTEKLEGITHPDELGVAGLFVIPCKSLAEQINVEAFYERLKDNPYQPMLF